MATKRFQAKAQARAQQDTVTLAGTWAAADTQTSVINEKEIVLTVGAITTTTGIAAALEAAINGDDAIGTETRSETGDNVPEFAETTAAASGSVVTFTGTVKGRPFTLTSLETTAGSGTATQATAVAATSPQHWDHVDNWGGSAIPIDTDVVYVDHTDVSILYGLGQSAIQPAALYTPMSFTGSIGLPEVNEDGGYNEYRKTYLELGPAIWEIGAGDGNGSGRLKLNSGTDQISIVLLNAGSSLDDLPAVLWKGTHAANTLRQEGGTLGVAVFGGEVATLATFTVNGGELTLGAGVTLSGALVVNGGTVFVNSLIDGSLLVNGGGVVVAGTGNVDQLTIRGGTVILNTTGTLGGNTLISGTGVLDLSQTTTALTGVTNPIEMYGPDCRIYDPFKRLGDVVVDCNEGASPAQVDWGLNLRLQRSATA